MIKYNHYSIENVEHLYGQGKRFVLWVQGCSLHCKGCVNYKLWDKNKGKDIAVDNLFTLIRQAEVDGITLLGGEPMEQSEELSRLVDECYKNGLSIVCFTGYELDELNKKSQKSIIDKCDFLICGKYLANERNIYLQFRGSNNQKVYFPTGKYKNYKLSDNQTVALVSIDNNGIIEQKGYWK